VRSVRILVLLALFGVGCDRSAVEAGRDAFSDPKLSTAPSNPFSCSTCHETDAMPAHTRPGRTMYDVVNREAWWGGSVTNLLDATNQCVTNFMRGRALTADDEKSRALFVYLESLSPDAAQPLLPLTVVQNIVDVPSGDPAHGAQVYKDACAICHGEAHTGNGRISDLASIIPDDTITTFGTDPKLGARIVTIEKVRHGKFFNVGGNMPLFSVEALADADLGDVLAYLEMFGLPQ
jgi:thiosulfate dehydrogenase